ncbi:MAG: indole-3-glycerol phosphate synthase TrpC [Syntrophobacterales bacterium]|nr:indole-3-glycerol phosphate synthase TrpC [Syntrophobacterales bacterium]
MDFLAKIVAHTLKESLELFESGKLAAFKAALATRPRPRSLKKALEDAPGRAVIAEVKRASPSKGELAPGLDPVELARIYERNGAAAISVLTERRYFHGSPEFLQEIKLEVNLPVLRKDFILEPVQVYESAALGADALLLLTQVLDAGKLRALLLLTRSLGLEALVEVHTREEMETALSAGADLIGINHRDLHTFEMHMDRALELAPLAPPGVTLVAASGLKGPQDLARLEAGGIRAFLIGESLVTSGDPGAKLREFLGVAP